MDELTAKWNVISSVSSLRANTLSSFTVARDYYNFSLINGGIQHLSNYEPKT